MPKLRAAQLSQDDLAQHINEYKRRKDLGMLSDLLYFIYITFTDSVAAYNIVL